MIFPVRMRRLEPFQRSVLFSLAFTIPIGFSTKAYAGPFSDWVQNSLSGIFYEIFWILTFFFFFPKSNPCRIAAAVFLATSVLEVGQLWHPEFLERVRGCFIGRTLIGTSFVWTDFPYYFLGCLFAAMWILFLKKQTSG
jgi:hypothetical protein